ncbi:hypothetical protein C8J56DRAFT_1023953 [Mycena floridula]|nr:hypothetical protein C8J56DRAFT_1023953 [Mycena floridula]
MNLFATLRNLFSTTKTLKVTEIPIVSDKPLLQPLNNSDEENVHIVAAQLKLFQLCCELTLSLADILDRTEKDPDWANLCWILQGFKNILSFEGGLIYQPLDFYTSNMPSIERFAQWASKFKLDVVEADKDHPMVMHLRELARSSSELSSASWTFDQVFRTTDLGYYQDVRGTPTNEFISKINQLSTQYMVTLVAAASGLPENISPRDSIRDTTTAAAVLLEFWR